MDGHGRHEKLNRVVACTQDNTGRRMHAMPKLNGGGKETLSKPEQ